MCISCRALGQHMLWVRDHDPCLPPCRTGCRGSWHTCLLHLVPLAPVLWTSLLCPGPSGSLRGSRDFPLQVTTRTSIPPGTTLQMLGSCSGARRMRCRPIGMSWASPMSSRSAFPFPAACCPGSWQVPLRLKNRGGKPVMAMMSPLLQTMASASGLLGSTPDLLWLMGQSLSVFI